MMALFSDAFLLNLLRLGLLFLNLFLVEPSRKKTSSSSSSSSRQSRSKNSNKTTNTNNTRTESKSTNKFNEKNLLPWKLQPAYDYFEITEATISRDEVLKMFKKLSLIHHPDRNANSSESILEMQTINQYHDLIQEDLDRETMITTPDRRQQPEGPTSSSYKAQDESYLWDHCEELLTQQQKHRQQQQHQTNRQTILHEFQKHSEQKRQRQQIEREMRKEWEDTQHDMREFGAQRNRVRNENIRLVKYEYLNTAWGRDKSHPVYMIAIRKYQEDLGQVNSQSHDEQESNHEPLASVSRGQYGIMDDDCNHGDKSPWRIIDDNINHPQGTDERVSKGRPVKKPRNPLMEYCNEDVVVAIRLGRTDIAMEILHREMQVATDRWISFRLREASIESSPRTNNKGFLSLLMTGTTVISLALSCVLLMRSVTPFCTMQCI
jgi:hypothetical protein